MVPTDSYNHFVVLKYLLDVKYAGAHMFHGEVYTAQ